MEDDSGVLDVVLVPCWLLDVFGFAILFWCKYHDVNPRKLTVYVQPQLQHAVACS